MARYRDVALVAALFGAAPVLAGTSIAKSEGMETPALNCAAVPATGEVPSTPVAEGAQGLFEALIADFRWGDPEMGAVPHLPVPPPYRMRAEDRAVKAATAAPAPREMPRHPHVEVRGPHAGPSAARTTDLPSADSETLDACA